VAGDHPYNSSIGLSQAESTVTSTHYTAQLRLGQKKSPCRQVNHQQKQTAGTIRFSNSNSEFLFLRRDDACTRACVNLSAKPLCQYNSILCSGANIIAAASSDR
jgi:hypothetical protein